VQGGFEGWRHLTFVGQHLTQIPTLPQSRRFNPNLKPGTPDFYGTVTRRKC